MTNETKWNPYKVANFLLFITLFIIGILTGAFKN